MEKDEGSSSTKKVKVERGVEENNPSKDSASVESEELISNSELDEGLQMKLSRMNQSECNLRMEKDEGSSSTKKVKVERGVEENNPSKDSAPVESEELISNSELDEGLQMKLSRMNQSECNVPWEMAKQSVIIQGACSMVASPAEFVRMFGGNKQIEKVLIANNGIAAVKCMRSMRGWAYDLFGNDRAIKFVVMVTPEDLKVGYRVFYKIVY
eukprot:gene5273-422_t